jgi:uncharacterized membrane protein
MKSPLKITLVLSLLFNVFCVGFIAGRLVPWHPARPPMPEIGLSEQNRGRFEKTMRSSMRRHGELWKEMDAIKQEMARALDGPAIQEERFWAAARKLGEVNALLHTDMSQTLYGFAKTLDEKERGRFAKHLLSLPHPPGPGQGPLPPPPPGSPPPPDPREE